MAGGAIQLLLGPREAFAELLSLIGASTTRLWVSVAFFVQVFPDAFVEFTRAIHIGDP